MEGFIYGAAGMLSVLLLLAAGAALGWRAGEKRREQQRRERMRERSEGEEKRQREDSEAFNLLMGYNAELAYGLTAAQDLLRQDEEAGKKKEE